jgi:hypothetical protein
MAAAVLTLVLTVIVAGAGWLTFGNRLQLHKDPRQNDVLNLCVYAGVLFPVFFVVVFFAMENF